MFILVALFSRTPALPMAEDTPSHVALTLEHVNVHCFFFMLFLLFNFCITAIVLSRSTLRRTKLLNKRFLNIRFLYFVVIFIITTKFIFIRFYNSILMFDVFIATISFNLAFLFIKFAAICILSF